MACVALLLPAAPAPGDVLRLKNGQSLEGLVRSTNQTEVVLDIGFGTVTLPRSSVASVERQDAAAAATLKKAWQQQHILHERYAPGSQVDLQQGFEALQTQRSAALQTHRLVTELQQALRQEELAVRQWQEQELALSKELGRSPGTDRQAVETYNNNVARLHRLRADILETSQKTDSQLADLERGRRELASYTAALLAFAERVKIRKKQGPGTDDPQTVAAFQAALETRLGEYQAEIQQVSLPYQRDRHRVEVAALLNGAVTGRLVVDTGASAMCITEALAQKLKLSTNTATAQVTLANGATCPARVALLSSVEIAGVRVEQVVTLILPQSPAPGVDGLLGMTFLMECNVRLDPAAGVLQLQRFAPR